jgi:hypothetical protein
MQQDPKGMVRTEMGRLVKKSDQDAWEKKASDAMQDQYMNRAKDAAKARAMKLGSMKKKKEDAPRKMGLIFDKESFEKLPSLENKMKSDKMNERKSVTEQLKKYNDTSVMNSNKRY